MTGRVFVNCMDADHASYLNRSSLPQAPVSHNQRAKPEETALALGIVMQSEMQRSNQNKTCYISRRFKKLRITTKLSCKLRTQCALCLCQQERGGGTRVYHLPASGKKWRSDRCPAPALILPPSSAHCLSLGPGISVVFSSD